MRVVPLIFLIVIGGIFAAVSIFKPSLLSQNQFLIDFFNHNFISVLTVVVTVSLVSITQIHLEYSKIERRFKERVFIVPRRTLNIGTFLLCASLFIGFLLAFLRAQFIENDTAVAFIHSISLLIVFEVIFIMYDIIRVAYVLASDEPF